MPADESEIRISAGEFVSEIDKKDQNWWKGKSLRGQIGYFPATYVELQSPSSPVRQATISPPKPKPISTSSAASQTAAPEPPTKPTNVAAARPGARGAKARAEATYFYVAGRMHCPSSRSL